MTTASALADKYIARTGEAPAQHLQEVRGPDLKWSPAMQAEFRRRAPVGIAVAVSYTAVSGREHDPRSGRIVYEWGGETGVRLARLWVSKTAPWETWRIDAMHRHSVVPIAMAGRLWIDDAAHIYRLEEWAQMVIAGASVEPDRDCWMALRYDADMAGLIRAIKSHARTDGRIQAVETDDELHATIRMAVEVGAK